MQNRKLHIMVTGPDREHLKTYIEINVKHYCRYFVVDKYGKDITNIQERRTRHKVDPRLNISTSDGISLGKDVLGMYDISIMSFSEWDKIPENIDAVIIAMSSGSKDYINDYMTHAKTYSKLLFVIVHTQFDYNSAEHVKEKLVTDLLDAVKQAKNNQEHVYNIRPAHIFVDLEIDSHFPYREYLTKNSIQDMLNTIWVFRPNKFPMT